MVVPRKAHCPPSKSREPPARGHHKLHLHAGEHILAQENGAGRPLGRDQEQGYRVSQIKMINLVSGQPVKPGIGLGRDEIRNGRSGGLAGAGGVLRAEGLGRELPGTAIGPAVQAPLPGQRGEVKALNQIFRCHVISSCRGTEIQAPLCCALSSTALHSCTFRMPSAKVGYPGCAEGAPAATS